MKFYNFYKSLFEDLEMTEPHLCEGCEDLSSEISRTKVELLKIQENLKTSISKLK